MDVFVLLSAIAALLPAVYSSDGVVLKSQSAGRQIDEHQLKDVRPSVQVQVVKFSLAKHFQDHMVLQKAPARANIYGFHPDIGQKVILEVMTSTKPHYYTTHVVQGSTPGVGVWIITLDPMEPTDPVTIKINAEAGSLQLNDVLFGDVWLCSGQSNMQFTVSMMDNAVQEIANAHKYPNIRVMTVAEKTSSTPLDDLIGIQESWSLPSNNSIGQKAWTYFSAVCWLYGKNLHKKLGYPIGLIATDWGGTPVEAWSSPDALAKCPPHEYQPRNKVDMSQSFKAGVGGPNDNSVLWNAMIHPFLKLSIYGAIWYQGEADAGGVAMNLYNCTFPAMINDWRSKFNYASMNQTSSLFPFGFVQLAPNNPSPTTTVGFPDIRWHQTADYGYVPNPKMPNVFMAVAMDLPDFTSVYGSIHPRDKTDVGLRLFLSGLAVAYKKNVVFQGPFPMGVEQLSDDTILISYGSWEISDVHTKEGFDVFCESSLTSVSGWIPTSIVSSNATSISIYSGACKSGIQGLRYAWRESPCLFKKCAVYGQTQLPAPPFVAMARRDFLGRKYFHFK